MMPSKNWTDTETAMLCRLRRAGLTFEQIAERIGRSEKSCNGKWDYMHFDEAKREHIREGLRQRRRGHSPRSQAQLIKSSRPDDDILAKRDVYVNAPRPLSAWLLGDPPPGWSALDRRG